MLRFTDPAADENMPQADIKEKYGEDYKPIYGLLERQRHKWAARFIWRRYLAVSFYPLNTKELNLSFLLNQIFNKACFINKYLCLI